MFFFCTFKALQHLTVSISVRATLIKIFSPQCVIFGRTVWLCSGVHPHSIEAAAATEPQW